jgi:hypothetical protein
VRAYRRIKGELQEINMLTCFTRCCPQQLALKLAAIGLSLFHGTFWARNQGLIAKLREARLQGFVFGGCHSMQTCIGDANDALVLFKRSLGGAGIFVGSTAGADRQTFFNGD